MSCSPCTKKVKIQSTGILFAVQIVDQVLATPDVKSLWESIIADLDSQVSNECSKLALENFIKLYVQVWSLSHAREIVNKYKLKEKALKKKTLRKELKKADDL